MDVSGEVWTRPNRDNLLDLHMLDPQLILGRIRRERWGSREIDIDILSYGSRIIDKDDLIIPHPEIENRSFVLMPMLEFSPEWRHPETGITVKEIWENWLLQHEGQEALPVKTSDKSN